MRGNNTNNYAEINVKLFKDYVLKRLKAYNEVALVDNICIKFEEYYEGRLLDVAHNRSRWLLLSRSGLEKRSAYIKPSMIVDLQNGSFQVPSSQDPDVLYTVIPAVGYCSCMFAHEGQFCKHQFALVDLSFAKSDFIPTRDANYRWMMAKVALGSDAQPFSFYTSLRNSQETPDLADPLSICEG